MHYYDLPDDTANCSKCHTRKLDDDLCHYCGRCDACGCTCAIPASWDEPFMIVDDEEVYLSYEGECNMCGKERPVNDEGYCSSCWQVWNS